MDLDDDSVTMGGVAHRYDAASHPWVLPDLYVHWHGIE